MSLLGSHRMQAGGELEPVLHPPGRLNSRIAPDACLRAGCNIPPAFPWPCSWQTLGTCLTRCREGVASQLSMCPSDGMLALALRVARSCRHVLASSVKR